MAALPVLPCSPVPLLTAKFQQLGSQPNNMDSPRVRLRVVGGWTGCSKGIEDGMASG